MLTHLVADHREGKACIGRLRKAAVVAAAKRRHFIGQSEVCEEIEWIAVKKQNAERLRMKVVK